MCLLPYSHEAFHFVDDTLNDTAAEGTVRLVGGHTPLEGRVEIFLLGQWGTVCDSSWDLADATVVCRALGYLRAVGAPGFAAFGAGSGPSWFSNVGCEGDEQDLTECSRSNISGSACTHSRDAGVICSRELSSMPHIAYIQSLISFHARIHNLG